MKATFILATKNTERPNEKYASKVIDAINKNCSYKREILVYSPLPVEGENVVWFEEKEISGGSIFPFNFLFKQSKGEYIFLTVDEYAFDKNSPDKAIEILESSYYKNKKIKILGMGSGIPVFPNSHFTSGFTCIKKFSEEDPDYRVCGFPVFHRSTVENFLDGFIFNPRFKHYYGDNWLPFFAGAMDEPIHDCPHSDLKLVVDENSTYSTFELYDQKILKELIEDFKSGKNTSYGIV